VQWYKGIPLPPQPHAAHIPCHLPQPPQEFFWLSQVRQVVVHADKDLLRQVLGVSRLPHLAQANRIHESTVLRHQVCERRLITFRCSLDQGHDLHHRGSSPS
jgi:hypothetical protein